ncbi:hypothetical protein HMPREF6485_0906 [Segatella buccae ATCC 33574]|uniref:Uncharacterized protein n=1 Tax=Segatella buccae ATCC 33574 TaxID=873513 RepID=E6K5R4_9BACT|nr:hypothetical protein HMPREF6485_0906 [Segatella buccae ATCC 33574]
MTEAGNGLETAQTGLQKGHRCTAVEPLLAFNCGSFANSESPKENVGELSG